MTDLLSRIDFGNEAGDDADPAELSKYFVEQADFRRFLQPEHKILVATAKKGVGKSALLQWAGYSVSESDTDALVIKCRGADLVRSKFGLTSQLATPNDHIRDWMIRLCAIVNRELALRVNLALSDDRITLVETAELDGYKSRNLVGCLLDRFDRILGDKQPKKVGARDEVQLLKRVNDRKVWILIDDLDATYQNTNTESLALSTFFSACRYLTQDLKDVYFRATMRTDVWALIRRYDESLDKMEQYVFDIMWYQKEFLRLLYLRVATQIEATGGRLPPVPAHVSEQDAQERLLERVFVPKMEWARRMVDTYKVIYTLSYERPRWAIQLCKLAQATALRSRRDIITKEDIDRVWGEYGTKRIADLVAEHKHQCAEIEELLNGFRGAERLMPRDRLFAWINNRILNHINARIEGEDARSPIQVAHFLYRLGFIMARSESDSGYEHYRFDQMPDFLTSRTDDDFGLSWEIHPCYREALDIRKLDRSHRDRFSRLRDRY
ncbi:MAG: hypothetical protein R3E88_12730 [Myxococcota bacterium]